MFAESDEDHEDSRLFSGRGFLGLPQKGMSIKTRHVFVLSEPSAIHHMREERIER
jgi:hypothetical protein